METWKDSDELSGLDSLKKTKKYFRSEFKESYLLIQILEQMYAKFTRSL
jgi:hypothetical protein